MKKSYFRILCFIITLVIFIEIASPCNAYANYNIKQSNESMEGDTFDIKTILSEGVYSEEDEYVTYDDMTFKVSDLESSLERIRVIEEETGIQPQALVSATYIRKDPFYSRGPQHRLATGILQPGQTGTLSVSFTQTIATSVTSNASYTWFGIKGIVSASGSIGASISNSISVSAGVSYELTNTYSTRKMGVISIYFIVYQYDINEQDWMGRTKTTRVKIYEPQAPYTYLTDPF